MVNHYEVYVIFQNIEHQLQENILYHFLHYSFYEIFIKLRSIFHSTHNYLPEAFATLPNRIDYLYLNIYDIAILYFHHNYSGICH